jgi:adenylate kinase
MKRTRQRKEGFSICVCGVPGVGKSTLLRKHVESHPLDEHIVGSSVVKKIIAPATVQEFDTWSQADRTRVREQAIQQLSELRHGCSGRLLVDGHFTLRNRSTAELETVFTEGDISFYNALVLLEASAEEILGWRDTDERKRPQDTLATLSTHLEQEREAARKISAMMGVRLVCIDTPNLERRCELLSSFLDEVYPL